MSRCSACDHNLKICVDTGPISCEVLAVGEKPGKHESYTGLVFIGDAGDELNNTYLPLAGLSRPEIRVTNCVRCRLGDNNNKPTEKQVDACASHHLPAEIERCECSMIILLGATACSLIPEIEIDKDHGIPFWLDTANTRPELQKYFGEWSGWIFPSFHPAAALHSTSMMIPLLEDFERFRLWQEGKWHHPKPDQTLAIDYRVLTHPDEIDHALREVEYEYLPIDTEKDGEKFWSLQFSPGPGRGYLIHDDPRMLLRFRKAWKKNCKGLLFHEKFGDLNLLESIGVWQEGEGKIRDTMAMAYSLGNQPQGLKALAWRLTGVRMQSWEDLVMSPSRAKMVAWLNDCWNTLAEHREAVEILYKKAKKPGGKRPVKNPIYGEDSLIVGRKEYKPTTYERACKRILSHSHKPKYDIWKKSREAGLSDDRKEEGWRERLDEKELEEAEHAALKDTEHTEHTDGGDEDRDKPGLEFLIAVALEREYGPAPIPSIANAVYTDSVVYACRDADMLGRVEDILMRELQGITEREWAVAYEDYDVVA